MADWDFADAWVLAAIGVWGRPCSLVELIAAAARIHHAVPRSGEVDAAVPVLVASGLVRVFEDWTFELTDDGMSLWSGDVRDLHEQLGLLGDALPRLVPVRASAQLPDGATDRALAEYDGGPDRLTATPP